ncbi:hypothetical protein RJ639_030823 [Escallonia herrerae]|uniref:RING-type domain-containing protein n=1 Tax=Escallonia herrerae TaxID=1293975 RepID=A0AA88WYP1_9ASTE|nr:hypothetical protein RJ639_030823 [Escallonia herrerae]
MPITHHHHLRNPDRRHADAVPINRPPPPKPNPKILSLLLKSVVMALILSLFLLFLGVAALALLHVLLAGSSIHRHRRRHSASPSAEDLNRHLPRSKYAGAQPADCAVCLDGLAGGDWCRRLPACGHVFHAECLDTWLVRVANCPICRARVRLDTAASGSNPMPESSTSPPPPPAPGSFKLASFLPFGVLQGLSGLVKALVFEESEESEFWGFSSFAALNNSNITYDTFLFVKSSTNYKSGITNYGTNLDTQFYKKSCCAAASSGLATFNLNAT